MSIIFNISGASGVTAAISAAVSASADINRASVQPAGVARGGADVRGQPYGRAKGAFDVRGQLSRAALASILTGTPAGDIGGVVTGSIDAGLPLPANLPSAADVQGASGAGAARARADVQQTGANAQLLSAADVRGDVSHGLAAARARADVSGQNVRPARAAADVRGARAGASLSAAEVLARTAGARAAGAIDVGAVTNSPARGSIEVRDADGVDVIIDIISAAASAARGARVYELQARLTANGVEVPFGSFQLRAPGDRLGAALNCDISKIDLSLCPPDALVNFDLLIWTGNHVETVRLMTNGRLAGRGHTVEMKDAGGIATPNDRLSISVINLVADRLSRAPRAPVILWNTLTTTFDDVKVETKDAVRTETGALILPTYEAKNGLTLRDVLDRAYVKGCGFDRVITNLPTFPVDVASFDLSDTWHGVAQSFTGLFDPVYLAEDASTLFIIDPERALPAGFSPRALTLSEGYVFTYDTPAKDYINAVLLTYKVADADTGAVYFTERVETEETQRTGEFGADGYTETNITRRIRETRNLSDNAIISESEISTELTVHGMVDGSLDLVHREKQQDTFDGRGLKIGHTKTVEGLIQYPGTDSRTFDTIETEVNTTAWKQTDKAGVFTLEWSQTETSGVVLVEPPAADGGKPLKTPILVAMQNDIIDPDADTDQSTENTAIRVITEKPVPKGGDQIELRVIDYDALAGIVNTTTSQQRTGSNRASASSSGNGLVARRMLLRDTTNEAAFGLRQPANVNASELPAALAIEFARRKLARFASSRKNFNAELTGVDPSVRRGTIFRANNREGIVGDFLVTGFVITGTALGTRGGHSINMTIEGIELNR